MTARLLPDEEERDDGDWDDGDAEDPGASSTKGDRSPALLPPGAPPLFLAPAVGVRFDMRCWLLSFLFLSLGPRFPKIFPRRRELTLRCRIRTPRIAPSSNLDGFIPLSTPHQPGEPTTFAHLPSPTQSLLPLSNSLFVFADSLQQRTMRWVRRRCDMCRSWDL